LSIEAVGIRRELVANSCTHRRRRRDATKQFRRVGVGGVYWALVGLVIVVAVAYQLSTFKRFSIFGDVARNNTT